MNKQYAQNKEIFVKQLKEKEAVARPAWPRSRNDRGQKSSTPNHNGFFRTDIVILQSRTNLVGISGSAHSSPKRTLGSLVFFSLDARRCGEAATSADE